MIKIEVNKRHTGTILAFERQDGTGFGSVYLSKEEEVYIPIFEKCIDECNRKERETSGDTVEVSTITK